MNIPFEKFYEEKLKIIGSLLEFGRISYVTKWDKLNRQMTYKTYNTIMVGYADNHTRDTYTMYNTDTKRFIMTRDVK